MMIKKTDHRALDVTLDTIREFGMVEKGDSVLISVSGGPDSVFLTMILYMLKEGLALKLYGFSLDHGTREGQSGRDLEFVKKLYKDLKIKLFTRKIDVASWCKENSLSFQEGARMIRKDLLNRIADDNGISRIALGHNLDDNVETFLMRTIRGAGARGLSGISPVDGRMIRPLINTPRAEIEDYLKTNKISFCRDSSNLEDKYLRNRIRNRLVPFIKENFQGDLTGSIKRAMEILRDEDTFLRDYALGILEKEALTIKSRDDRKTIYFKIAASSIKKNPGAVKRRIIQTALEKMLGSLEDISYRNIEDISSLAEADNGENKWLRPAGSIMVLRIGRDIHMADTRYADRLDPDIRSYILERSGEKGKKDDTGGQEIRIDGITVLKDFKFSVKVKLSDNVSSYGGVLGLKAVMDYDLIDPPVRVRKWSEGDRFHPLGMDGSKKLQDLFMDCKIPVNRRGSIPVFYDRQKIIWVGTIRLDNRVKVTGKTSRFLCLELFEN